MSIKHLINDTYQVINDDDTIVYFQGSLVECHLYMSGVIN